MSGGPPYRTLGSIRSMREEDKPVSLSPIPQDSSTPAPEAAADARETGTAASGPVSAKPAVFGRFVKWATSQRAKQFALSWTVRLTAILIGIAAWHWLTKTKFKLFVKFENVPPPGKVWTAFLGHLHSHDFYVHIAVSMERIAIAYALAAALGILLGVAIGRSRLAGDLILPYIEILRPIPAVAWIPLAILMWPTEESSIIYITFLGALFPIVLNTAHGAEQTPDVLVRAAQSLGASRASIFWHVVIPAALPSITAGLAIGMGVAWFSLLAGEIISGQYGIGYFTWDAYSLINYQDIVIGMLVIGVLGTLSTYAVRLCTRPLLKWQESSR